MSNTRTKRGLREVHKHISALGLGDMMSVCVLPKLQELVPIVKPSARGRSLGSNCFGLGRQACAAQPHWWRER